MFIIYFNKFSNFIDRLHDYSFTRVQTLSHQNDCRRRLKFCKWLVRRYERDPSFVNNILFTDESCFAREGPFNYKTEHYWSDRNLFLEMPRNNQNRLSVNLWAGIIDGRLVSILYNTNSWRKTLATFSWFSPRGKTSRKVLLGNSVGFWLNSDWNFSDFFKY